MNQNELKMAVPTLVFHHFVACLWETVALYLLLAFVFLETGMAKTIGDSDACCQSQDDEG